MTSAARPTFFPARGGNSIRDNSIVPSLQHSVKDLPGHTKIKVRQDGQGSAGELKNKDLKEDLERREREHRQKHLKDSEKFRREGTSSATDIFAELKKPKLMLEKPPEADLDKDESDDDDREEDDEEDDDNDDDDTDDDDEDDTDELMRELEKIKKERAEEQERIRQEQEEEDERRRNDMVLTGNPLINARKDFSVKRRWDDDVVFKNQAKGEEDQPKKRFINDTIRSDFHRKFMSKYIH